MRIDSRLKQAFAPLHKLVYTCIRTRTLPIALPTTLPPFPLMESKNSLSARCLACCFEQQEWSLIDIFSECGGVGRHWRDCIQVNAIRLSSPFAEPVSAWGVQQVFIQQGHDIRVCLDTHDAGAWNAEEGYLRFRGPSENEPQAVAIPAPFESEHEQKRGSCALVTMSASATPAQWHSPQLVIVRAQGAGIVFLCARFEYSSPESGSGSGSGSESESGSESSIPTAFLPYSVLGMTVNKLAFQFPWFLSQKDIDDPSHDDDSDDVCVLLLRVLPPYTLQEVTMEFCSGPQKTVRAADVYADAYADEFTTVFRLPISRAEYNPFIQIPEEELVKVIVVVEQPPGDVSSVLLQEGFEHLNLSNSVAGLLVRKHGSML
jgi:hypothetical protein